MWWEEWGGAWVKWTTRALILYTTHHVHLMINIIIILLYVRGWGYTHCIRSICTTYSLACGSNVKWNGLQLVACMYDVDNHTRTSKCTHSHWPLHLVSCQSNLSCQNSIFPTKALPPNAALAQLPIVQGKGEMTNNVLYTILLCECAWHCVCICMRRSEYNMCQLYSLFVWNCVCVHGCIYICRENVTHTAHRCKLYNFSHTINPWMD